MRIRLTSIALSLFVSCTTADDLVTSTSIPIEEVQFESNLSNSEVQDLSTGKELQVTYQSETYVLHSVEDDYGVDVLSSKDESGVTTLFKKSTSSPSVSLKMSLNSPDNLGEFLIGV